METGFGVYWCGLRGDCTRAPTPDAQITNGGHIDQRYQRLQKVSGALGG